MGKFNNDPYKSTPVNTKNRVVPDEPSKPIRREKSTPVNTKNRVVPDEPSKPIRREKSTQAKTKNPFIGANNVDAGPPPTVKKIPVKKPLEKKRLPIAKATPKAKSRLERMKDAYEDLGYAKDFKEKHPEEYAKHRGLEYNKPKAESTTGAKPVKSFMPPTDNFWGDKQTSFAKGGAVKSSASSRSDGCAQRGKTRGRVI